MADGNEDSFRMIARASASILGPALIVAALFDGYNDSFKHIDAAKLLTAGSAMTAAAVAVRRGKGS